MFRSREEASRALADVLPRQIAKKVAELSVPAVSLTKAECDGTSRAAGAPILPRASAWPERGPPADPKVIAARGGFNHSGRLARHLSASRPLTLLMQVDLGDTRALAEARDLPSEGVLSFFYDVEVGPWDSSTDSCRVVLFLEGEEGAPPDGPAETRHLHAAPALYVPHPSALDFPKALASALRKGDVADDYADWVCDGPVGARTKLLGSPDPEQQDPIATAVAVELYGEQHLTGLHWRKDKVRILEAAKRWRLLAQVELAAVLPGRSHAGIVFFLILRDDLAARDFSKVFSVYQQS